MRHKLKRSDRESRGVAAGPPRGACVPGAQLEDLLIALAERRSFPETRFLVARGIVGETWSAPSAAVPASVLVLPVKEPGEGRRDGGGGGYADRNGGAET